MTVMRTLLGCVAIAGVLVAAAAGPVRAQFSLPVIDDTDCSARIVDIMTTDAQSTVGFDIDVAFDSGVIAVQDVTLVGTDTADCEYAFNDTNADIVNISIACTTAVTGPATIARIIFVPVAEGPTDLTFAKCQLDEDPCPGTTNGSLSVSGCPSVNLSASGAGAFGLSPGRVCLTASLTPNGSAVASASTEITFDSSKFAVESCSINPSAAGVGKSLNRNVLGAGHELISVTGGAASIPSGTLYACTLTVVSSVSDGSYSVTNAPTAADASSVALPASGVDGVLHVTSCAADCNGSGDVGINEVSRSSGLFLGDPLCNASNPNLSCPNADSGAVDGSVLINEVSRASCLFINTLCSKTCP